MKTIAGLSGCCAALTALAVLAVAVAPAAASTFSVSYTDGGSWSTIYAQGFSPSVEPSPDLGLSSGDIVNLDEFDFFKSGNADGSTNIQLAILNTMWYDFNTPLTTSSSSLVGLSTNTLADTAGIATGDPVAFLFDSLPLWYGGNYAAVAVTDDGLGNLTPVKVSALTADYVETSEGSGVWAPELNYGGDSVYDYAVSDYIDGGYFSTYSYAADANFVASLSVVPEPGTLLLALCGVLVVGCAGRRRG